MKTGPKKSKRPPPSEGACPLCGEHRVLVRSHILPELLWSPVYDPETGAATSARMVLPYDRTIRRGIREPMLCRECDERRLGKYEDYFAKLWYGNAPFPDVIRRRVRRNVDYTLFKLFHLAILWRAHLSALPEFSRVALSASDAGVMREALFTGVAPPAEVFPITGQAVVDPSSNEVIRGLLALPVPFELATGTVYAPIYGGCLWFVGVTPGVLKDDDTVLRETGDLVIPTISIRRLPGIADIMFRNRDSKRGK